MIIVMVVMDGGTIVVLFGVSQRLFRVVSEVGYVLLILIVRVMTFRGHWVIVFTVKTAMMVRAIIEVLRVVMGIMMSMLHLVVCVMVIRLVVLGEMLWLVGMSVNRKVVMISIVISLFVMEFIHALDVVIIMFVGTVLINVVLYNMGGVCGSGIYCVVVVTIAISLVSVRLSVILLMMAGIGLVCSMNTFVVLDRLVISVM